RRIWFQPERQGRRPGCDTSEQAVEPPGPSSDMTCRRYRAIGQGCRIAATSNSSATFLLTTPGAAFQCTAQSLRLIVTLPSKPTRKLPRASGLAPVSLKSTETGLVSARMVRAALTVKLVAQACRPCVEV